MRADLRILMLTTSYPRWLGDAAGNFVAHLAEHLHRDRGCDVRVWSPATPEAPDREVMNGVPVDRVRYAWPASAQKLAYGAGIPWNMRQSRIARLNVPFFLGAYAWRLISAARGYDILHAHWGILGALAVFTRPIHRRPVVVTIHGSDLRTENRRIKSLTHYAIARADAVVTPSTEFHRWCLQLRPDNWTCRFLPNGVDMPPRPLLDARLSRPLDDAPVILSVGRLIAERKHDLLLRAFAEALKRHPRATLRLVGDGPFRPELESLSRQLGLGPAVTFVGAVDHAEVSRHLLEGDLYVSPTTIENFGTSVVEASAHGLPSVTTRVGFPAELVLDGKTGRVVEPADQGALTAALLDMLADPARLRQSGRDALARFESLALSWDRCTEELMGIYRRLGEGGLPIEDCRLPIGRRM